MPHPTLGDLPDSGIEPGSPTLQAESLTSEYTREYIQFSSVAQSCLTLCDPMDCSMPGFPVHHQLLELALTHVQKVSDVIQPSHLPSSPLPAFNLSQNQGLFK